MSVTVVQGSILDFEGDAIVNPANSFLRHGGGLARVIDQAARASKMFRAEDYTFPVDSGISPVARMREDAETHAARVLQYDLDNAGHVNIPTGGCGITSAGVLPYQAILHAVGPIWGGGGFYERALLTAAHNNACTLAYRKGFKRIAFPAISCGIFGYPVSDASLTATKVADAWRDTLDITFCLFEDEHYDYFRRALRIAELVR